MRTATAADLPMIAPWTHDEGADERGAHLRQLFVSRTHRRRAIGSEAIRLFRERCVPAGSSLSREVLVHNPCALAFWRALGMREHATLFRLP